MQYMRNGVRPWSCSTVSITQEEINRASAVVLGEGVSFRPWSEDEHVRLVECCALYQGCHKSDFMRQAERWIETRSVVRVDFAYFLKDCASSLLPFSLRGLISSVPSFVSSATTSSVHSRFCWWQTSFLSPFCVGRNRAPPSLISSVQCKAYGGKSFLQVLLCFFCSW